MTCAKPTLVQTPQQLGQTLRAARTGAGMTLEQLAGRTGFSMRLLSEAERGKPGVSIGRIMAIAAAAGVNLSTQRTTERHIDVGHYPQLRLLTWQGNRRHISERDALALYEANWRFVDSAHLSPHEAALIQQLVQRHGHGVLNV